MIVDIMWLLGVYVVLVCFLYEGATATEIQKYYVGKYIF